jgi:hypothetical protein
MKTLITTLAVASLIATSAIAKTAAQTNYADGGQINRHRGSHAGKLYGGMCTYIGGWKQGYPGTENSC